ncbi:hypothetical protein A2706_01800 [Candidatus Peribacteria bacterium RIFCSPHIGHO2_01_FULL_51_35]|nr:MAG: hypothetical protein A2706_01800 [Candidatus Peribacteria bacterium RIFCSPHIGHO2_01_FULL_51_35]
MRKLVLLSAIALVLLLGSVLTFPPAQAMFREGALIKSTRYQTSRDRESLVKKCEVLHMRYNQQTDRCECKASLSKAGYCGTLNLRTGSGEVTGIMKNRTDEQLCGAHGLYGLKGCMCEPGYKRRAGHCVFLGKCPAGYNLNKNKQCITRGTVFQRQEDWKLCTTTRPCTCDLGYEPMGNRVCIPR